MPDKIKNVFVSHHHKDDKCVDGLTNLVSAKGYKLRNSSIRLKPENQKRLDRKELNDNTIRRLLRSKMRWAGKLIVIIGKETYQRYWVNWEIKVAHQLGMSIIGVYDNGLNDNVEIPQSLRDYATSIVGWSSNSIIKALEGKGTFEETDGNPSPRLEGRNISC